VANVHVMQVLLSYLSRKQKIALRLVCKDFGEAIAFKSLVSLRFTGNEVIKQSKLFENCVRHSRKVAKLQFEDASLDHEYLSAIEKALGFDAKETSDDLILANKGVRNFGEYFRSRVTELEF